MSSDNDDIIEPDLVSEDDLYDENLDGEEEEFADEDLNGDEDDGEYNEDLDDEVEDEVPNGRKAPANSKKKLANGYSALNGYDEEVIR